MFFQQTQSARNAVDEAEESEMGAYYLDPPPWIYAGRKRLSTASVLSAQSRRSTLGGDRITHSRSTSVGSSRQPSRQTSIASREPGSYGRQSSALRSSSGWNGRSLDTARPSGSVFWRYAKRVLSSSLGLFLFIQTYLCIGAFCFMWIEEAKEKEQMGKMASLRFKIAQEHANCSDNVTCHQRIIREWERNLLKFPQIYLEIDNRLWSWTYSYYCSFTIISTIGYGNVTPLSVLGRMFAVVYAVVGIPLMLLFITDIGNKLARWTKIAIIKFRKRKYKICQRCKRIKRQREDAAWNEEGGRKRRVDSEEETKIDGEGSPKTVEDYHTWTIPEVHINIAMSTLDEEACEVETKDIRGAATSSAYCHRDENDRKIDKDGKSYAEHVCISPDVKSCCTEIPKNAFDAPSISKEDLVQNRLISDVVPENAEERKIILGGHAVDLSCVDGKTLDSARARNPQTLDRKSADAFLSGDVLNADSRIPANESICTAGREDKKTLDNDRTAREALAATDSFVALQAKTDMCKHERSDILQTYSLEQQKPEVEKLYDTSGQSMQNVHNVSTNDVGDLDFTHSKSDKERNTESVFGKAIHDLSKPEQYSSHSVDGNTVEPSVCESPLQNKQDFTGTLSTTFHQVSNTDLKPLKEHQKLSRKKSKSLEDINALPADNAEPGLPYHRSALKGNGNRRTSAPGVVSFQTKPAKQNGRLPNRQSDRCNRSGQMDAHTKGDYDSDFRDRNATDSGVASSTSNSTECSPKRRPNSIHLNLEATSHDDVQCGDDDAFSEDDVMDSEEEKSFEKLRQLRFGASRASLGGREYNRVAEADIAMLSIPIWLALLLLLVYLLIGAGGFAAMQGWSFLDGFYYCFISLSTIGFGDLVFLPQNIHAGLVFSFLYSFFGLCFTSMCMSLSSMELTLLYRKIAAKFGVYKGRIRQLRAKRWASRRRKAIRATSPNR